MLVPLEDHGRANRLHAQLTESRNALASSEAGRGLLGALLDDPSPAVRLWAAASCPADNPRALSVLEELRGRDDKLGLVAMTLLMVIASDPG